MKYTILINDMCRVSVLDNYDHALAAHGYIVKNLLPGRNVKLLDGDEVLAAADSSSTESLGDVLTDLLAVNDAVIEWASKIGLTDTGPYWNDIIEMAVKVRAKIAARN